ncbi:MAG: MotA/TolQ/ExbB proton channel family protein [Verrucomicrobia bacterium]|nr:MotA/TolQ/ExbB proton channel family protein [Verrucomicrobiota bacterium]
MLEFFRAGGPFMWLLLLTSVIGLTFIIERGLALRWNRVVPVSIEKAVEDFRAGPDAAMLKQVCLLKPSPLGRLLLVAIEHFDWPRTENETALQTRARHEVVQLERGLVVLEIVVGIAPLLGLVGTIHGLITLFGDLAHLGTGDNTALAKGIAIALNTTLTGLLIAIPSLIAWSYYNKKVEMLAVEIETICDDVLRRFYRGRPGP